jgi:hypothetical protein
VHSRVLLPWERLLWSRRPWHVRARLRGERYFLTDFRLLRLAGDAVSEIALDDISDIQRAESRLERLAGTSTIAIYSRDGAAGAAVGSPWTAVGRAARAAGR